MILGVLEEAPLWKETTRLDPGSALVLYTDGVTEARNQAGEFFDIERLIAAVQECEDRPVQELRDHLLESVHQFVGEAGQEDDVTVVVLARPYNDRSANLL